jgi:hypothetical protein
MTVNKTFSGKDIALAFKGTGGLKALIRWGKKERNRAQFYSMFKNELIAGGLLGEPHVETNDRQLTAVLEQALLGAVRAVERGDSQEVPRRIGNVIDARPVNSGGAAIADHSDVGHGIVDTGHAIVPPKPKPIDDGLQPRPKPDVAQQHAVASKPKLPNLKNSDIVGLFAGSTLEGPADADPYGRNWSQTTWRY